MFYGSSTYKKWEKQNRVDQSLGLADIDKEYEADLKKLKEKYNKAKKGKTKEERTLLEKKYKEYLNQILDKREKKVENLKSEIFSKYQKEVELDYQVKLKEDQTKIKAWREKGLDPIEMFRREIHKEKLEDFKEELDKQDLTNYNRRSLIYNEGKRIKERDLLDATERVKNADENKITKTIIDRLEDDYNEKAREFKSKNKPHIEPAVSETFSETVKDDNISSNTANEIINNNKSDRETIEELIEKYNKSNKREKSGIKKQLYKRFGKTIEELTEENKKLKSEAENIKTNSSTTEKIIDDMQDTVKEADINNKTTETIKDTVQDTVEKSKTVVDETVDNVSKTASEAGEGIKKILKGKKAKTGLFIGAGVALIGGFINLLNRNRTVVHLEMNEQLNQQPQQGGGYGTITPTDNLQRRMGNYKINTNVRDTF